MTGKLYVVGAVMLAFSQYSLADSFDEIIKGLDKPYAVTIHKQTGVRCVWTKNENGFLESENFGNEGTGLCWSKESLDDAKSMDRHGSLKWNRGKSLPKEFITDIYNSCFYGYMGRETGDWTTYLADKYAKTISKYSGDGVSINKLGRAFDYGKISASSPNDCSLTARQLIAGD
ncbi:hypothetical protein ACP26C_13775 [Franconibacter helveticus 513]|uniref:hypothetical protein n=1 Tax=Franconibacter helveticus TaxID=357240 RepID=UPI000463B107|nr:hypothetical protein [Franconibacter helveticus]